jgi:hypothetical protein
MTDRNHSDVRQGIVDTCREMNRNGLNLLICTESPFLNLAKLMLIKKVSFNQKKPAVRKPDSN